MRYWFGKRQRVLSGADFTRTLRKGTSAADDTLVVYALKKSDDAITRLGVTIPRKAGGAVVRNRWKRLIREAYRTQQDQVPAGFDYVIRPRKGAEPVAQQVRRSLLVLARKATRGKRRD